MDDPSQTLPPETPPDQAAPVEPPPSLAASTREAALAALADALRDDPTALAMSTRIAGQTYVAVRADVGLAIRVECRGS